MSIIRITKHLEELGIPLFWQIYVFVHILFATSVLFISNALILNISNILLTSMVSFGVLAGIKHYQHKFYPWGFLAVGVVFIGISIILHSLIYLGVNTDPMIILGIEQAGMVLISIFSFTFMWHFEKEFNLNGFTVDYSLIIISLAFFICIISPSSCDWFLFEISLTQQLNIINLSIGLMLLSMTIINHVLCKLLLLKDIVRIIGVLLLISHFSIDVLDGFTAIESYSKSNPISWSVYHLAGSFIIIFTFLEKLTFDFHQRSSEQMSSLLMWVASVLAVLVFPIGIFVRAFLGFPPIDSVFTSIIILSLSTLVIFRFVILIHRFNQQRNQLKVLAYADELTGVLNYRGFDKQYSNISIENSLVVAINIEDFKSINDLYGRVFGDEVIRSVGHRLQQLEKISSVARTGSDSFLFVLQLDERDVRTQIKCIQKELGVWNKVMGERIAVPLTFGASHSNNSVDTDTIVRQAEKALRIARSKRTSFYLYEIELDDKHLPRHELRGIMQQAIDDNFLPVHFQPIYNLESGSLSALELLIRLDSKEHGLLHPGQFLEQAQAYGLLTPLTKVCINMIVKRYSELPDVVININLPSYMLDSERILNEFLDYFKKSGLSPSRFCIEVMEDEDISAEQLLSSVALLKDKGFLIAMDDFGTGHSSLSRLSILPFDTIKIDRSLLLAASTGNKAILESSIALIKRLGLSVVVEGVETLEQLTLIRHLGADLVQGYLLSKPVHVNQAIKLSLDAGDIVPDFHLARA